jgi:hypothetical protein
LYSESATIQRVAGREAKVNSLHPKIMLQHRLAHGVNREGYKGCPQMASIYNNIYYSTTELAL